MVFFMDTGKKPAPVAQAAKDEHVTGDSNKSEENEMAKDPQSTGQGSSKDPNDGIFDALNKAVSGVPGTATDAGAADDDDDDAKDAKANAEVEAAAKAIALALGNYATLQTPARHQSEEATEIDRTGDPCAPKEGKADPNVTPFCVTRKRDLDTARTNFSAAKGTAASALKVARDAWAGAVSEYEFEMANAKVLLRAAAKIAIEEYEKKRNPDSHSRNHNLYYTMQLAIATAVQALETSAGTAASTLAGAAGSLLGAHATYVAAINAAQSQRLVDEATAKQTFWNNVEDEWDK